MDLETNSYRVRIMVTSNNYLITTAISVLPYSEIDPLSSQKFKIGLPLVLNNPPN